MRPIPAPRIGESHGLLRAISQRERIRLDEFVTEFSVDELFPPGLENALGRTRQFVSFARSAGLLKEDRGVVELTEIGKRYVRGGDESDPFSVSPAQADWLRRQLLEKHMTDSIFHGLAIGLSLLSSVPPGTRISTLDFGRSLGYLGRAGWDNDNTLQIQGGRYLDLLRDIELIDEERALTRTGHETKAELTLPIHMSLSDIAAQLNPGGAEAVRAEGEAEWAGRAAATPEPAAPAPAPVAPAPAGDEEEDEWQDVGPGARTPVPAASPAEPPPPPPAATAPTAPPAAPAEPAGPPVPPADVWQTSEPYETTSAYAAVPAPGAPEQPPAPAEPPEAVPPAPAPAEAEPPAGPGFTAGDPLAAARPQDAPTVISQPAETPPPARPRLAEVPPPAARTASGFLAAAAIRSAAESHGLRLAGGVYANVAAALATGRHVVVIGPPGSGKTTLALAIAQAAATAGRSSGAVLVTAAEQWTGEEVFGQVVGAAARSKWMVIDELDRAPLDAALGGLSSFLSGLPVTVAGGEEVKPPGDWRIVATATGSLDAGPALWRRFAHVELPASSDADLEAAIDAAAGGDATAAGAARRLLVLRELRALGPGVFTAAAAHAAERNAIEPADERTLAREAYNAYCEGLLHGLDDREQVRLRELLGGL